MMANNKKIIIVLIAGITNALRKGYKELNKEGQYPVIENDMDLVQISNHIVAGLNKQLAEITENERFDGMTPEQIHEAQAAEKELAIKKLLDQSAEALRKLRPAAVVEAEELDEEGADPDDPDAEGDPGDDSISETYKALVLRRSTLEKEIKEMAAGSVAFNNATAMLDQINQDIAEFEKEMVG
jgi:hypothetical protein